MDPQSPATIDLQTLNSGVFNSANFPALASYVNPDGTTPTFLAARGDADLNSDDEISHNEKSSAIRYDAAAGYFADVAYDGLRDIRAVTVTSLLGQRLAVEHSTFAPQLNDFLVTYASAFPVAEPANVFALEGNHKKDHGTIADADIGRVLLSQAFSVPPRK